MSGPTRREFMGLGVGLLAVAAIPALSRRERRLARRTLPVMGTLAEVVVVHPDRRYAQGAITAALDELRAVERTMTRFSPDSDIGRTNAAPRGGATEVGEPTALVVEHALRWARQSEGRFDPCLARVAELWDVGHRAVPPAQAAVRRLAGRRLYEHVGVDRSRERPRLVIDDLAAAIDLGGIAKGYGVDRAAQVLREWGIRDGLVNVGGDLFALGVSEDGDAWEVGVRSPDDAHALATTVRVTDAAVATSGDYEQYFVHEGQRYHHIFDAGTGAPVRTAHRSLTVWAPTCLEADASATAAFGLSPSLAARSIEAWNPEIRMLHSL